MKLFKLYTHQKSFSVDDLILNPKEHPEAKLHDVVEIYHPDEDVADADNSSGAGRLLLQITGFNEELKGREIISVESNIAAAFNLRTYADVIMRVVHPSAVALDSVEITFKDQYMGRSEMWRLKKFLTNTCVYTNKKLEYCSASIRCQVYEMWSQGDRVSCGVITDETKVVFRSSTSMVYLFIQMSSEMWDFDIHGDLYFEKAVNGFLTDLFGKWRRMGSNHEVTIVLFSRTFYAARTLDEFPVYMRECLQQDYRGRFYEDFYRVAVQNERSDDWSTTLVQLRRLFTSYPATVLRYHERAAADGQSAVVLPVATNSTAAQGNFLEVLNISLNVFEKHYLDRSFDRTGQLSVVITPGVGVFEVDRELTNITKQRIIDNGVGSDLVCVGEQPLHAVPLLKFHNKDASPNAVDDYSMPHWINLSFYSTNKKVAYSTFIPRIKLPPLRSATMDDGTSVGGITVGGMTVGGFGGGDDDYNANRSKLNTSDPTSPTPQSPTSDYIHNSLFDYDAYDAQIFTMPPAHGTCTIQQRLPRTKKTSVPCLGGAASTIDGYVSGGGGGSGGGGSFRVGECWDPITQHQHQQQQQQQSQPYASTATAFRRKMSDPDIHHGMPGIGGGAGGRTVSPAGVGSPASIGESMSHLERHGLVAGLGGVGAAPADGIPSKLSPIHSHSSSSSLSSSAAAAMHRPGRALINPFAPSHVTIKLTSNRRRWTHIFPKGPTGVLIQQHHHQAVPGANGGGRRRGGSSGKRSDDEGWCSGGTFHASGVEWLAGSMAAAEVGPRRKVPALYTGAGPLVNVEQTGSLTLLWGATGEQEWTPALTTGVDWKSLTIPACLPITTDYFPDKRALHNDYLVSEYTLLPDGVNIEYAQNRAIYRRPLSTEQVFAELVSQRLAQGFQLIILPDKPAVSPAHLSPSLGGGTNPHTPHKLPLSTSTPSNTPSSAPSTLLQPPTSLPHIQRLTLTIPLLQAAAAQPEPTRSYLLSIGRIFHKISLVDRTEITVTRYRPRHPYPPINVDYRYRFKAPQHDRYEMSGVHFATEKLENFNWNYMDQYICTRGDTDYPLLENLKYWRFRMFLLPREHAATKRIIDPTSVGIGTTDAATATEHCDIYLLPQLNGGHVGNGEHMAAAGRQNVDDFVRFLEIHMNKLKKLNCLKLSRGSPTTQQSHLTRRRHSTSFMTRPPAQTHATSSSSTSISRNNNSSSERLAVLNGNTPARSGSKNEKGPFTRVSPGSAANSINNNPNFETTVGSGLSIPCESNLLMTNEDNEETFLAVPKLSANASLGEIHDALKHPVTGVCFVARAQSLPSFTFVLWDAINWLAAHVDGCSQASALEMLEAMRKSDLICHASGDCTKPVRAGFFLYYISSQDTKAVDYTPPVGDLHTFENEWIEVEICDSLNDQPSPFSSTISSPSSNATTTATSSSSSTSSATSTPNADPESNVPPFLRETLTVQLQDDATIYKQSHLEIDAQQKSDRIEWGHIRYHRQLRPAHAFEICTQWLTASGPIVYDHVYVWMRKAQQCGFQLIPVPADPLAEPFTEKSDPLRGPIFVPLAVQSLERDGQNVFREFRKETWPDRLLMLQEAIVQRFGFLGCAAETRTGSNQATLDRQYVHCSGNMFVLVALPHESLRVRKRLASGGATMMKRPAFMLKRPTPTSATGGQSGGDTHVTRLVAAGRRDDFDGSGPRRVGFMWAWNHMIANKKWKSLVLTNSPDAELFQLRMLQDFKDFCANKDGRLVRFWEESWMAKEAAACGGAI